MRASLPAKIDIRASYKALPFQPLWTWLSGKGLPLEASQLELALQPVSTGKVMSKFLMSWLVIGTTTFFTNMVISANGFSIVSTAAVLICWLAVVNRGRALQATFHYMSHGAACPNQKVAYYFATIGFSAPFLHSNWWSYKRSHVAEHHSARVLASSRDPDTVFLKDNGIYPGISEHAFWIRVWLQPFNPMFIFRTISSVLMETIYKASNLTRFITIAIWIIVSLAIIKIGATSQFTLLFVFPVLILLPHSLWVQLITEHQWFRAGLADVGITDRYAMLSWGRYQGRLPPSGVGPQWLVWLFKLVAYDLPVRLYILPEDLPNHDFHHKRPKVGYSYIADVRETFVSRTCQYPEAQEVWGYLAALRIIKTSVCQRGSPK